jgi:hypothetical protein
MLSEERRRACNFLIKHIDINWSIETSFGVTRRKRRSYHNFLDLRAIHRAQSQ